MLRENQPHNEIAMLIVDIDNFKEINDKHGHETGDRILKKVANLFKHNFRADDYVCRIGGDEFAVIMHDITNNEKDILIGKIQKIMDECAKDEDGLPAATLSAGIAFGKKGYPIKELYKDADSALYKVKNNGRNNIKFFDEDDFVK